MSVGRFWQGKAKRSGRFWFWQCQRLSGPYSFSSQDYENFCDYHNISRKPVIEVHHRANGNVESFNWVLITEQRFPTCWWQNKAISECLWRLYLKNEWDFVSLTIINILILYMFMYNFHLNHLLWDVHLSYLLFFSVLKYMLYQLNSYLSSIFIYYSLNTSTYQ